MSDSQVSDTLKISNLSIVILCCAFVALMAVTLGFVLGETYDPGEVLGRMTTRSAP